MSDKRLKIVAPVKNLDTSFVLDTLNNAVERANAGEVDEVIVITIKDGIHTMSMSASKSCHQSAGILMDAAVSRLGYKFRDT
jgi:hypothetical protein